MSDFRADLAALRARLGPDVLVLDELAGMDLIGLRVGLIGYDRDWILVHQYDGVVVGMSAEGYPIVSFVRSGAPAEDVRLVYPKPCDPQCITVDMAVPSNRVRWDAWRASARSSRFKFEVDVTVRVSVEIDDLPDHLSVPVTEARDAASAILAELGLVVVDAGGLVRWEDRVSGRSGRQ